MNHLGPMASRNRERRLVRLDNNEAWLHSLLGTTSTSMAAVDPFLPVANDCYRTNRPLGVRVLPLCYRRQYCPRLGVSRHGEEQFDRRGNLPGSSRHHFLQPDDARRQFATHRGRSGRRQLAHVRADLRRPSLQSAEPDQRANRRQAGPGLEPRIRHHARSGSDAAGEGRRHLHHRQLERGVRHRREDRRDPLDLRSQGASRARLFHLLRRGESRRGALSRQGLRRHAGRPPDRARRTYRHAGVGRRRPRQRQAILRSPALRASPRAW